MLSAYAKVTAVEGGSCPDRRVANTGNGMHTEELKRIWSLRLVILWDTFRAWRTDPKFGSLAPTVLGEKTSCRILRGAKFQQY